MSNYKVGDKVVVTDNTNSEPYFEVGDVLEIFSEKDDEGEYKLGTDYSHPLKWHFLYEYQIKPYKEPKMDIKQALIAYTKWMEENCPPGSEVRVIRHWSHEDAKIWDSSFPGEAVHALPVGSVRKIEQYINGFIIVDGWTVPAWCLEPIPVVEIDLCQGYTAVFKDGKVEMFGESIDPDIIIKLSKAIKKAIKKARKK